MSQLGVEKGGPYYKGQANLIGGKFDSGEFNTI